MVAVAAAASSIATAAAKKFHPHGVGNMLPSVSGGGGSKLPRDSGSVGGGKLSCGGTGTATSSLAAASVANSLTAMSASSSLVAVAVASYLE